MVKEINAGRPTSQSLRADQGTTPTPLASPTVSVAPPVGALLGSERTLVPKPRAPAVTVVVPASVLVPDNVRVPEPATVRAPAPALLLPVVKLPVVAVEGLPLTVKVPVF